MVFHLGARHRDHIVSSRVSGTARESDGSSLSATRQHVAERRKQVWTDSEKQPKSSGMSAHLLPSCTNNGSEIKR